MLHAPQLHTACTVQSRLCLPHETAGSERMHRTCGVGTGRDWVAPCRVAVARHGRPQACVCAGAAALPAQAHAAGVALLPAPPALQVRSDYLTDWAVAMYWSWAPCAFCIGSGLAAVLQRHARRRAIQQVLPTCFFQVHSHATVIYSQMFIAYTVRGRIGCDTC